MNKLQYVQGIFLPAILNLATKWDRHLLVEDSQWFMICDATNEFWWKLMTHEAL